MIECSNEERLARESVIRKIGRLIEDLNDLQVKIEMCDNLFETYFPIGMNSLAIEYGKLVLLSMGYLCQRNSNEKS